MQLSINGHNNSFIGLRLDRFSDSGINNRFQDCVELNTASASRAHHTHHSGTNRSTNHNFGVYGDDLSGSSEDDYEECSDEEETINSDYEQESDEETDDHFAR